MRATAITYTARSVHACSHIGNIYIVQANRKITSNEASARHSIYKLRALAADPVSAHADLTASVRHIRIAAHKFYISPSRRWRDITGEDEIKFILCWILSLYQEL
jgi:hypothetical protein